MSKSKFAASLCLLLACGEPKGDSASAGTDPGDTSTTDTATTDTATTGTGTGTGTGTATDDQPTVGTTTTTTGTATGSTTSDDSAGTTEGMPSTTTGTMPDLGEVACDPFSEDCPEGQKCSAFAEDGHDVWNAYKCVPIVPDPDQLGEPCTVVDSPLSGLDSCDKHLMCWDVGPDLVGECVPLCTGSHDDPTCDDPKDFCAISGDGVLILCLPTCDPLLQDCEADEVCVPHNNIFACAPDLSGDGGQVFDPCEFVNVCEPGLVCVEPVLAGECDPNEAGCCLPFCDLTLPNDCPGAGQMCLPWFANDPPPEHANLGVCGVG